MRIVVMRYLKELAKAIIRKSVILALRLLQRPLPLRVAHLRDERIGHLIGNVDLYLRRLKSGALRRDSRLLIISGKPCNQAALQILKRYLPIVQSQLLSRCYWIAEPEIIMRGFREPMLMLTTENEEFARVPPILQLSAEEEARGRAGLERMGIGPNDWFVCFHARDSAYLNTFPGDFSYHDFRDGSIENCIEGMKLVTSRGGHAIRLGSVVARPLIDTGDARIIDYASRFRSDFMDIYLCARCRFFIGNTSGLFHVAKAFGVPYAIANLIGFLHLSPQPMSLVIPKLLCRQGEREILSFAQMRDIGLFNPSIGKKAYLADFYKANGLEPVENDSDDMKGLTQDMFDLVEGKRLGDDVVSLQHQFKDLYFDYLIDRHDAGNLAPSFIRRHKQILFSDAAPRATLISNATS